MVVRLAPEWVAPFSDSYGPIQAVAEPPGRCRMPAGQPPLQLRPGDRCPIPPWVDIEVWERVGNQVRVPAQADALRAQVRRQVSIAVEGQADCDFDEPTPSSVDVCLLGAATSARSSPREVAIADDGTATGWSDGFAWIAGAQTQAATDVPVEPNLRRPRVAPLGDGFIVVDEPNVDFKLPTRAYFVDRELRRTLLFQTDFALRGVVALTGTVAMIHGSVRSMPNDLPQSLECRVDGDDVVCTEVPVVANIQCPGTLDERGIRDVVQLPNGDQVAVQDGARLLYRPKGTSNWSCNPREGPPFTLPNGEPLPVDGGLRLAVLGRRLFLNVRDTAGIQRIRTLQVPILRDDGGEVVPFEPDEAFVGGSFRDVVHHPLHPDRVLLLADGWEGFWGRADGSLEGPVALPPLFPGHVGGLDRIHQSPEGRVVLLNGMGEAFRDGPDFRFTPLRRIDPNLAGSGHGIPWDDGFLSLREGRNPVRIRPGSAGCETHTLEPLQGGPEMLREPLEAVGPADDGGLWTVRAQGRELVRLAPDLSPVRSVPLSPIESPVVQVAALGPTRLAVRDADGRLWGVALDADPVRITELQPELTCLGMAAGDGLLWAGGRDARTGEALGAERLVRVSPAPLAPEPTGTPSGFRVEGGWFQDLRREFDRIPRKASARFVAFHVGCADQVFVVAQEDLDGTFGRFGHSAFELRGTEGGLTYVAMPELAAGPALPYTGQIPFLAGPQGRWPIFGDMNDPEGSSVLMRFEGPRTTVPFRTAQIAQRGRATLFRGRHGRLALAVARP